MSKENDLEGTQDMGGKHGGQAGMPQPDRSGAQQGIVRDERAQEQPVDKDRAQKVTSVEEKKKTEEEVRETAEKSGF